MLRRDFPFTDQGTVKIKSRLNFRTGNKKWGEEFSSAAEYSLFSELLTCFYVKIYRKCCSAVEQGGKTPVDNGKDSSLLVDSNA